MGTDSKNRPQPLLPKKQGVVSTARLGIGSPQLPGPESGGGRRRSKGSRECQAPRDLDDPDDPVWRIERRGMVVIRLSDDMI